MKCIISATKELSFTVKTCIWGSFSENMSWKPGSHTLNKRKMTLNGYMLLPYFHLQVDLENVSSFCSSYSPEKGC
jgi:hypothetical protein